ncbi:hypothetical protein [Labilibaculum euxinus]
MKKQFYFENEDADFCHPLEYFTHDAKIEGLKEINIIEAVPDFRNEDTIWCTSIGAAEDRSECKKDRCDEYIKGKGNICDHRGKLYSYGEQVTIKL